MATTNLAEKEELVGAVVSEISTLVNTYKSHREEVDEMNRIADYMYSCAQNRSIESAEKGKGMNMDEDTRANVGSALFHRIVNQLASQLEAVLLSKPDLWKYVTFSEEDNDSTKDGENRAKQMNLLAKYTLKQDQFLERLPMFSRMLFKRSNIFAKIQQVREESNVTRKEPVYEIVTDEITGEARPIIVSEKDVSESKITKNFPSVTFPPCDSIYLDRNIADMQQQYCVAMLSKQTRAEIFQGVTAGWYSEEQYKKIGENEAWDGQSESVSLQDKEEARNQTVDSEKQKDLFLVWDVYINLPLTDSGEMDTKGEEMPERYWLTLIGNDIGSSVCVRFEKNPEPDNEIPLKDIHVYPDDGDRMYHTTTAELCRSAYSVDCTLLALALDNMGLANDPVKTVVDTAHSIKDFTYRKGAVWHVSDQNAVKTFDVRDNTQPTLMLKNEVEQQMMTAMSMDKGQLGQSQGARTSASEATFINRNSMQPHLSQIRYILMQLLPWMARKEMSYWGAYGLPEQVVQIADENKQYHRINPTEVDGEFDVKVEIIDEYESDILKQQNLQSLLNIIASNEWLQKSSTEEVDGPSMFKEICKSMKLDPSTFLRSSSGGDAERRAREDVELMLYSGEYAEVRDDSDFKVHLRVKEQELVRWKGVEQQAVDKGIRVDLLAQHVAELKEKIRTGASPVPQQQEQMQMQTEEPTVGQEQGQAISTAMEGRQI